MQHFSDQLQKVSSKQSNTFYWRRGRASCKKPSRNTLKNQGIQVLGNLHMRRQGLQSTKGTPHDEDLEEKIKNVMFCTTVDTSTTKEGNIYSELYRRFLIISIRKKKYIYVMFVYYCNAILTTATKNRSDKDMIISYI